MPTYEYRCDGCGHQFELFQQMTDPVKRKCPKCGKPRLQRLIGTGAGVIFKGGGFYETDYRSDSYKQAAEADTKAAEPAGDRKPDAKADKPVADAKAESKSESASEPTAAKPAAAKPSAAKPARRRR